MYLAWKEIRYSKLRYGLIIGIMFLVAYVVFILSGLANGLAQGNRQAIDDWQAKTIVLSEDSNKIASASQLTRSDVDRVEASDKTAVGIFSSAMERSNSNDKTNVSIFGADSDSFIIPKIKEGRSVEAKDEIVISENLENDGFKLNQTVKLGAGKEFKIVGIVPATTYMIAPVVYMNLDGYTGLKYGAQPFASDNQKPISAVVVKDKTPSQISITTNDGQKEMQKLTSDDFVESLPGYKPEKLTLDSMIYFLFVVVAAIIGIFMYVMTLQKTAIFGVMKAQGVSTGYLVRSILAQSLIVGIVGVALAVLFSELTSLVLPEAMPFTVDWLQWGIYSIILVVVAMVGGLFSIRTVTKVDPVTAIGGE